MKFSFRILNIHEQLIPHTPGQVFLSPGNWDDYSFKTSFEVYLLNHAGEYIALGTVKIGHVNQPKGWTRDQLSQGELDSLPPEFFSLGQDVKYYKTLHEKLISEEKKSFLSAMRDVVQDENILAVAEEQKVFVDSLTRTVSLSTVMDQFRRVLVGAPELTNFYFTYIQLATEKSAPIELEFEVKATSTPSTNVHVLIGRNGVGKTTILNNMISALMGQAPLGDEPARQFLGRQSVAGRAPIPPNYFSSVVSVSFSAFDPFLPPKDRQDRTSGPGFFYIGMKNARSGLPNGAIAAPKTASDLVNDFVTSFKSCLSQSAKRDRWLQAVRRLESDVNFADMSLGRLLELDERTAVQYAGSLAARMSSGHSIVLLTITRLVDTVEEKTLVLLDEPESHLHPPLLSAFTRALSDLLHDRNGVAIIATHSPVVLQEVPKSCVWKLTRIRAQGRFDRPERETFGENVGVLTREVFGLEVSKSGFHEMLERAVEKGLSYEQIMQVYDGQLGTEAKAIVLSLIAARNKVTPES